MNNFKEIVLDNGLKVQLFNNNKKNRTIGSIYINCGGLDNHFIYDGKEYTQPYGVAHFLEHYLIEKSIYGNIGEYFDDEYINSNGITGGIETEYFISTVHDFEENFKKLLRIVNCPQFDEEKIEDVKNPIISEIHRKQDNPDFRYDVYIDSCINDRRLHGVTLGEPEDIKKMTIDDLKLFHDAFYQPSNQTIVIVGNFDEDSIIKLIEEEYNSYNREYKKTIRDEIKDNLIVKDKKGTYIDKDLKECINLIYKFDVSSLTPREKNLLWFFTDYVLSSNYSERSGFFTVIKNKGISIYSPSYNSSYSLDKNIYIIEIKLNTTNYDAAVELLKNHVNELVFDREEYHNFVNNIIISFINRYESIYRIADRFHTNSIDIGYEHFDTIEDIKNFDFDECKALFDKLDFSNVCYVKRIKGE